MCSYYALIRKFIYIYIALKVYNLTINIRAIKVLIASHMHYFDLIIVDAKSFETDIYFNSYYSERLSTYENECKKIDGKELIFSDHKENHCLMNCVFIGLNETFSCLLMNYKHLISNEYKICE